MTNGEETFGAARRRKDGQRVGALRVVAVKEEFGGAEVVDDGAGKEVGGNSTSRGREAVEAVAKADARRGRDCQG